MMPIPHRGLSRLMTRSPKKIRVIFTYLIFVVFGVIIIYHFRHTTHNKTGTGILRLSRDIGVTFLQSQNQDQVDLQQWQKSLSLKWKKGLITLFTRFNDEINLSVIQRYVIQNWGALAPNVQPVLFTTISSKNSELMQFAKEHSWTVLSISDTNAINGTSFIKTMFLACQQLFDTFFYGYASPEILFSKDLLTTLQYMKTQFSNPSGLRLGIPLFIGGSGNLVLNSTQGDKQWQPINVRGTARRMVKKDLMGHTSIEYFFTAYQGFPWSKLSNDDMSFEHYKKYLLLSALYFNMTVVNTWQTNGAIHLRNPGYTPQNGTIVGSNAVRNDEELWEKASIEDVPWYTRWTTHAQVELRKFKSENKITWFQKWKGHFSQKHLSNDNAKSINIVIR